jgi:hypothetical protein
MPKEHARRFAYDLANGRDAVAPLPRGVKPIYIRNSVRERRLGEPSLPKAKNSKGDRRPDD